MKHKLTATIFVLLLVSSLAKAQESAPANLTVSSAGATISDFKGKVSLQLPGQSLMAPSRGQFLPPETTVNTEEGRLLLRLADGSQVLVRPHTVVIIKEPEGSTWRYLQLLLGRIRSQVQKHLGGTPAFKIGTPSAIISVRGTQFEVEVNRRGFTEVDVEEGLVELESLNGRGETVLIPAGFSSRVGMDSGPETPRPTYDLRPLLDRPGHKVGRDSRDEDPIRRLEAADRGGGDRSGSGSSGMDGGGQLSGSGGNQPSGSDDGSNSGPSSGSTSGSDGGSSSSDGGSTSTSGGSLSGSDGGSSGSDGGSTSTSGGSSSGSDGGNRTSGSGDRSGSSDGGGSSGDRHGGRPPE